VASVLAENRDLEYVTRLLGGFYSFHTYSRINLHSCTVSRRPGRTPPLLWGIALHLADNRPHVPVPPHLPRCAIGSRRHAPAAPRLGRPGACDTASHPSILSPLRTFSTTSGVIPAKRLAAVTFCLPSIIDSGLPRRAEAAGSMRQSKPSLSFLACTHVFNNFWGYPGKTPSYRHFPPSLDQRWRPITPRFDHRTDLPTAHIS